jgi:hypothetical protein
MEGGVTKYHTLPTVFSGNDYKATLSANEVKRMDWHSHPLPQENTTTDENTHTRSLLDSIQDPHPYCSARLNFGAISEQRTFFFFFTISILFPGEELQ